MSYILNCNIILTVVRIELNTNEYGDTHLELTSVILKQDMLAVTLYINC
jgi:hypothetical protein